LSLTLTQTEGQRFSVQQKQFKCGLKIFESLLAIVSQSYYVTIILCDFTIILCDFTIILYDYSKAHIGGHEDHSAQRQIICVLRWVITAAISICCEKLLSESVSITA